MVSKVKCSGKALQRRCGLKEWGRDMHHMDIWTKAILLGSPASARAPDVGERTVTAQRGPRRTSLCSQGSPADGSPTMGASDTYVWVTLGAVQGRQGGLP